MDDIRITFIHSLNERGGVRVDEGPLRISKHITLSLLDSAFYIICSYIREERCMDKDWGMGRLEREYLCTYEFMNSVDAREWIDENREADDIGLLVHIFDHVYDMTPGKHRRSLLYILNMLYFGL